MLPLVAPFSSGPIVAPSSSGGEARFTRFGCPLAALARNTAAAPLPRWLKCTTRSAPRSMRFDVPCTKIAWSSASSMRSWPICIFVSLAFT
jgi:hypothetical protein